MGAVDVPAKYRSNDRPGKVLKDVMISDLLVDRVSRVRGVDGLGKIVSQP